MNEYEKQACPKCGETKNVVASGCIEADGNQAWHWTTCLECGCDYIEVYEFSHIEIWEEEEE